MEIYCIFVILYVISHSLICVSFCNWLQTNDKAKSHSTFWRKSTAVSMWHVGDLQNSPGSDAAGSNRDVWHVHQMISGSATSAGPCTGRLRACMCYNTHTCILTNAALLDRCRGTKGSCSPYKQLWFQGLKIQNLFTRNKIIIATRELLPITTDHERTDQSQPTMSKLTNHKQTMSGPTADRLTDQPYEVRPW